MKSVVINGEIDILIQAYRSEKKEIQKYNLALELFKDDPRSADFLQKLIADETLHMKWIREKIDLIDRDFFKKYEQSDIFVFKINQELTPKISIVDMLSYSLYEEKFGALFHGFCKESLEDKNLKELFRELEAAEIAHINSIRYEIDYLSALYRR